VLRGVVPVRPGLVECLFDAGELRDRERELARMVFKGEIHRHHRFERPRPRGTAMNRTHSKKSQRDFRAQGWAAKTGPARRRPWMENPPGTGQWERSRTFSSSWEKTKSRPSGHISALPWNVTPITWNRHYLREVRPLPPARLFEKHRAEDDFRRAETQMTPRKKRAVYAEQAVSGENTCVQARSQKRRGRVMDRR